METLNASPQALRQMLSAYRGTAPCPSDAISVIALMCGAIFSADARPNFQRWKYIDRLAPYPSGSLNSLKRGIIVKIAKKFINRIAALGTSFTVLASNFQRWKFSTGLAPFPSLVFALWIPLMDKVVWLVAGNKGGVGKSVVAKAFVEWLQLHETPVLVVDGDTRTPDVHLAFHDMFATEQFDLNDEAGWQQFSDFLCETDFVGHTVTNLPDGISNRALMYSQRLTQLAQAYQFQIKVLFVINTLPDGLHLFNQLRASFNTVFTIKNLYFGESSEFDFFDHTLAQSCEGRIILLPKMMPRIMALARASHMPFHQFATQEGDAKTNFIYARLVMAEWLSNVNEALDDVLLGE